MCEDPFPQQALDHDVSRQLVRSLAELRAADNILELPGAQIRSDGNDAGNQFKVEFCKGWFIVFRPNHKNPPMTDFGKIDWSAVYRIKLLEITGERYD